MDLLIPTRSSIEFGYGLACCDVIDLLYRTVDLRWLIYVGYLLNHQLPVDLATTFPHLPSDLLFVPGPYEPTTGGVTYVYRLLIDLGRLLLLPGPRWLRNHTFTWPHYVPGCCDSCLRFGYVGRITLFIYLLLP